MDAKSKEEEQLLQDASTLLMFANVAAKQQQEQQRHSPPLPIMNKQAVPQIMNTNESKSINHSGKQINTSASIAGIMNNNIDNGYNQGVSNQPSPQVKVPVPNRDDIRDFPLFRENETIQTASKSLNNNIPSDGKVSALASKLVDGNDKPKPDFHSRIGSNNLPETIHLLSDQTNKKILEKSDSSVVSSEPTKESLPLKGSFIPTFKQSQSQSPMDAQAHTPLYNHHHSPGSANVNLARGINLETGERNSNNAVIAAAALAAAADIPLPLKRSDIINNSNIKTPIVTKELSKNIEDPSTELDDDDKTEDEAPKTQIDGSDHDHLKHEENKESIEEEIRLSTYQVDPDSGMIGCLCEIDDDDGFTIQCDVCYRWQHCLCMGFKTNEEVPEDEYKCYLCDESKRDKFDKDQCRMNTLKRLGLERSSRADSSISNNSDNEDTTSKRKNSGDLKGDKVDKRRRFDNQIKTGTGSTHSLNLLKSNEHSPHSKSIPEKLPNKENELLDDGISAENYQTVYYKLSVNDYKNEYIKDLFDQLGQQYSNSFNNEGKGINEVEAVSLKDYKSIKYCNIILPNQLKYLQEHKDIKRSSTSNKALNIRVRSYADTFKQKFNGIAKLGLFISPGKSTNQEITIPEGTPILEYLGEIDLFDKYVNDSINQYEFWGTTKPKVLKQRLELRDKFLDIVIDSRFVGNESRFIRNSCPSTTNCKIKVIYIPELNSFRFLVVTSKEIKIGRDDSEEELRLPWNWDRSHPIHKFYEQQNLKFDSLNNDEKALLISNIDKILHFIECGCSTTTSNSNCAVFKIKKATSYLLRSTRKVSLISNVNLIKSKEELIAPKRMKHFISWNERLAKRDKIIQLNLSVTTDDKEIPEIEESGGNILNNTPNDDDPDKTKFFKLPYRNQLLAQIKGDQIVNKELEKVEYLQLGGELPIPIIPHLSSKIEKTLNEKLNLDRVVTEDATKVVNDLIQTQSSVDLLTKEKDNLEETKPTAPNDSSMNINITPITVALPPVKKKLSFADYKKKMK